MAWLLQPHDYRQVLIPNFYRVDYGRVGAYKGMGRLGQANCPSLQQLMGVTDLTDPCQSQIDVPQGGLTVVNPSLAPASGPYAGGIQFTPNVQTSWLQQNSGLVAIGAVLLVILAASRR